MAEFAQYWKDDETGKSVLVVLEGEDYSVVLDEPQPDMRQVQFGVSAGSWREYLLELVGQRVDDPASKEITAFLALNILRRRQTYEEVNAWIAKRRIQMDEERRGYAVDAGG